MRPLKSLLIILTLHTSLLTSGQAAFESTTDGAWTDPLTWNCVSGDCTGRKFPGELSADVATVRHTVTHDDPLAPIAIQTLYVNNSTSYAYLFVALGATLDVTGQVTITGNAPVGSNYDATIVVDNATMTAGSVVITRNQAAGNGSSAVSLRLRNSAQMTIDGNVVVDYQDAATSGETTNEVWVGDSSFASDFSILNVGGNVTYTMSSQSSDNASLVCDGNASVTVQGTMNLALTDGADSPSAPGTSIVRVDLKGSAVLNVVGDLNLSFNDMTGQQSAENVEVLVGYNGGSPTMTVNNVNMTSVWNGAAINTYIRLGNSGVLTVNGTLQFSAAGTSSENRIELNGSSSIRLKGNITNVSLGSFDFIGVNTEIQFNGSGTQQFPRVKAGTTFKKVVVNNSSSTDLTLSGTTTIATSLSMTLGKVQSTSSVPLTFADGATSNIGFYDSFIKGPVKKLGTSAITLPLGRNSWGPMALSGITSSTTLTLEYFDKPYTNLTPPTAPPTYNVSGKEYWAVSSSGSPSAVVTLYWKNACYSVIGTNASSVVVGNFNGTNWVANASTSSGAVCSPPNTTDSGSAISTGAVALTAAFTFLSTDNVLPVELSSFNVEMLPGQGIEINWTTRSEHNNDYFRLLKSRDGRNFDVFTIIDGAGTSSETHHYAFMDENPFPGYNYYQLVQIDFDGKEHRSDIAAAKYLSSANQFLVFPNPGVAGTKINIGSTADIPFTIETIESIHGVDVSSLTTIEYPIRAAASIMFHGAAHGAYIARVRTNTGLFTVKFFIH